jgi:hypothetical protein
MATSKIISQDSEIPEGYFRVSSILKPLLNFGGVDPDVIEAKRRTGSAVHEAIRGYFDGIYVPLGKDAPYFDSFKKWLMVTGYDLTHCEFRLNDHQLKISGGVDAMLKGKGEEKNIIVDWKSVASMNLEYCELQGRFYHHLATINGMEPWPTYIFVKLHRDGSCASAYKFKASEIAWNQCLKHYYRHVQKNLVVPN